MRWSKIRHFTPQQFDDPEVPGSGERMDLRTVVLLDYLQGVTGWRIVPHAAPGVRGCVCVDPRGHAAKSFHYVENGATACDFHFETPAPPRDQALRVLAAGFPGVGIYYGWQWEGSPLPIGFHVDHRPYPQVWRTAGGETVYLLR